MIVLNEYLFQHILMLIGFAFRLIVTWLIVRYILGLFSRFPGGYGRLLHPSDCMFHEDITKEGSKLSIATTLELDDDITVEEIRTLFQKRVLNAKLLKNGKPEKLRYPEFKQYITSVFGFSIWKDEDNFQISEHITEAKSEAQLLDLNYVHQQLLNRNYKNEKSPWEIIIYRNVILMDKRDDGHGSKHQHPKTKTVLAFRIHHMMADAKSILKVFVECMGQKTLKMAAAREDQISQLRRSFFCISLPFYFLQFSLKLVFSYLKDYSHPWRLPCESNYEVVLKFSKPLSVKFLKAVAQENNVTTSAVIIHLITEVTRNYNQVLARSEALLGYVMSRENHPNTLANHWSGGIDYLPKNADFSTTSERLLNCDSVFQKMKQRERRIIFESGRFVGLLPKSWFRETVCSNHWTPVGITNIAGEQEGFYIGKAWCSGFRMSATPPRGVTAAGFCLFSYRDELRVAIIGRKTSDLDIDKVVKLVELEYDKLQRNNTKS